MILKLQRLSSRIKNIICREVIKAMKHLAENYKVVVSSPNPEDTFCCSPESLKFDNGRMITTMDFGGPGVVRMDGHCQRNPGTDRYNVGKVFVSD